MEELILEAEVRQETGRSKVQDLRDAGFLPAVVYAAGKESLAIKVSSHEFIQLVHQHRVESAVINLKIKDDKKAKARPCLIKEIQYDPVHGDIKHVDFNEISLTKAIKINVPISVKGESVGAKQEGGSLEVVLWEVEVECLPMAIPKQIEVDVTNLKLKDSIYVKDLHVPSDVKITNDPQAIVLTISEPMKEEVLPVEAVEGETAPQEPEVIKEKKELPAEEGEAEAPKEKEKEKEKK